jgi:hypothetical protein
MGYKFKNTVITQNNKAQKTTPSRKARRGILSLTAKQQSLLTAEQQRAEYFLLRNNKERNTSYCETKKSRMFLTVEQKKEHNTSHCGTTKNRILLAAKQQSVENRLQRNKKGQTNIC